MSENEQTSDQEQKFSIAVEKYEIDPKEKIRIEQYRYHGQYQKLLEIMTTESRNYLYDIMFDHNRPDRADFIHKIVKEALNDLDRYKNPLKSIVKYLWNDSVYEAVITNPIAAGEILYIDQDDELISLDGEVGTNKADDRRESKYIKSATSYKVLTGVNKGKIFSESQRPISKTL